MNPPPVMQGPMARFLRAAEPAQGHPIRHAVDVEERLNASVTGQQLLLGEIAIPIGEDPTGETRGVSDGLLKGWVDDDGTLQVSIFSRDVGTFTTLGESLQTALDALQAEFDALVLDSAEDFTVSGTLTAEGDVSIAGALTLGGSSEVGFYGASAIGQQTVTGSRSGGAALENLLDTLSNYGLLINGTSA